ncbi:MAG: helix-turn-helix transcriptional regulator, partial [Pseudobutyrivibrio sp.]|nr:helix-turn-helix transcriptional regulator [Pseudobutyrivibrio sp.]
YELTKREGEILKLLMEGKDNAVICDEILITPNTLKKHILNIYRKLGINSRVQLFKLVKEYE